MLGATSTSTFSIPGTIKQGLTPFVIDPNSKINGIDFGSALTDASPQFFSYRMSNVKMKDDGYDELGTPKQAYTNPFLSLLGIYPSTAGIVKLNKDISFKLLYDSGKSSTAPLTITDFIANLPAVSIREFLPDSRLDQCLNFFLNIFQGVQDVLLKAKDDMTGKDGNKPDTNGFFKKIWNCARFTISYLLGMENAFGEGENMNGVSFLKDLGNAAYKQIPNQKLKGNVEQDYWDRVYNFPFTLYYNLQSCTTTNIYEIPAMCEGKPILASDGKAGWGDGNGFMDEGGFRASGFLNKIPMIGELANAMLGNIGINYMPWWNAESGTKTKAPEVNIKFDLFNDTIEKALVNFIFINTIVPNNMWVQYGMFQHSSNLYDVKIEGINRLFACSGLFNVTYDGVLRNPPDKFFKLLEGHISKSLNKKQFIETLKTQNIVKIPDVYHVEMSFQSLLPANFNNFLFSYVNNNGHIVDYSEKAYVEGVGGKALGTAIGQFVERIKNVYKNGNIKDGTTKL